MPENRAAFSRVMLVCLRTRHLGSSIAADRHVAGEDIAVHYHTERRDEDGQVVFPVEDVLREIYHLVVVCQAIVGKVLRAKSVAHTLSTEVLHSRDGHYIVIRTHIQRRARSPNISARRSGELMRSVASRRHQDAAFAIGGQTVTRIEVLARVVVIYDGALSNGVHWASARLRLSLEDGSAGTLAACELGGPREGCGANGEPGQQIKAGVHLVGWCVTCVGIVQRVMRCGGGRDPGPEQQS